MGRKSNLKLRNETTNLKLRNTLYINDKKIIQFSEYSHSVPKNWCVFFVYRRKKICFAYNETKWYTYTEDIYENKSVTW